MLTVCWELKVFAGASHSLEGGRNSTSGGQVGWAGSVLAVLSPGAKRVESRSRRIKSRATFNAGYFG